MQQNFRCRRESTVASSYFVAAIAVVVVLLIRLHGWTLKMTEKESSVKTNSSFSADEKMKKAVMDEDLVQTEEKNFPGRTTPHRSLSFYTYVAKALEDWKRQNGYRPQFKR